MFRNINVAIFRKPLPVTQTQRAGKPKSLDKRDLLRAFSGQDTILGINKNNVYVSVASLKKSSDNICIMLIFAGGDPTHVKTTMESIFFDERAPVKLPQDELDLRKFTNNAGLFTGNWRIYENAGFSFVVIANADYEIHLSDNDAPKTFLKIFELLKERMKHERRRAGFYN